MASGTECSLSQHRIGVQADECDSHMCRMVGKGLKPVRGRAEEQVVDDGGRESASRFSSWGSVKTTLESG